MKTTILALLFSVLTFTAFGQITKKNDSMASVKNEYSSLWTEVSRLEEQSLPQSAIEKVNSIYQKALTEKNSPQLIKALIHQLKYESFIDTELIPARLAEIEQYTRTDAGKTEQSVLYAVLSQLYFQYYQANNYRINQRTSITGYVPEDIREWSGNLFIQQIADYVNLSLQAEKELQSTDILTYQEILSIEKSSLELQPTLYDFLINQGIDLLSQLQVNYMTTRFYKQSKLNNEAYLAPVKNFVTLPVTTDSYDFAPQIVKLYQQWLSFRLRNSNRETLLFADLERLNFVHNQSEYENKDADYLKALESLETAYKNENICAEILYKKALYYAQNIGRDIIPYDTNEDQEESLRKGRQEKLRMAYETCLDGIKRYPDYKRIGILTNYKNQLSNPKFNVSAKNTVYPGKSLDLKINYLNLDMLTVEIYRIMAPVSVYENVWDSKGQYKNNGKLLEKKVFQMKNQFPYLEEDTLIQIEMKDPGCYEYVIYSGDNKAEYANSQFSVSQLAAFGRAYSGQYEFLVTDRISGKPISGAKVKLYKNVKNQHAPATTLTTGKDGLATIKFSDNNAFNGFNASFGKDSALTLSSIPWNNDYQPAREDVNRLDIFTDRGIYRPGQTVFFKGIAYESGTDKSRVLSNASYSISLRNANDEEVAKKTLKTNEFGSFSGEFILPQQILNGSFSIGTENYNERIHFQVEEYKRPSFDLKVLPNEQTFHFGDTVIVKGNAKSFSGISIQNSTVQYRVVQRFHWLWKMFYRNEVQIAQGTLNTNSEGDFEVRFPAEKNFNDKQRKEVYYTYEIQVSLTDEKGETQEASSSVSVGDKSMYIRINGLPDNLDKDKLPEIIIQGFNLDSKEIQCSGTFRIHQLTGEESLEKELQPKDWKTGRLVTSGEFVSGKTISIASLAKEKSGKYRISVQSKDNQGREIETTSDFVLYSITDKQPPVKTYEWILTPKTTCATGENAEIIYGSSAKNVSVLYELFKDGQKLESSRFELNNSTYRILVPFKESYGEGIIASLTFIKDSRLFTKEIEIRKKEENKALVLHLDVFRDKLLPGQKEEWKLSVKDADNQAVSSEVLASMYDLSLDKLYSQDWYFHPEYSTGIWTPSSFQGRCFENINDGIHLDIPSIDVPDLSFGSFNWFGFYYGRGGIKRRMSTRAGGIQVEENKVFEAQSVSMAYADGAVPPPPLMKESVNFTPPVVAMDAVSEEKGQTSGAKLEESVQIRQNFNETAFFYPQLRTNEAGETLISFTVPESNTTWKFRALAHTKDLKYGQLVKEAISQKKLMVSPNMPRFIRQGDKTTISSTISNLSQQDLSGTVNIEFFDPNTQKTTIIPNDPQRDFTIASGKTTAVSWTFEVPSEIDMTACRIVAKTDLFSDGEQHLLPVLPNRMLVTESLPLSISGKQTQTFTLDKLVKNNLSTLKNYRLTLEFASNPAWYAIQALPAMTTPSNENVISWFAAYYANSLAVSIANNTPGIKQVIDTWTKQGGTKETLLSSLEKNQELKAVLLKETPWVMEAKDETEQKQQLSLLFDINRSENLSSSAIAKLKELQSTDGGWSWFKGMNSDISITQWLLYGMGQLSSSQAINPTEELKDMQANAIAFIDRKFKENFENLKKYNKEWQKKTTISTYELEYLFIRSFYPEIAQGDAEEAAQFYATLAEKQWTNNTRLYDRAITAIFLHRTGKAATAQAIIKSLREHASQRKDMGMYWANNNARTFMFQSATAVHTFIMQAFEETGATEAEMNAMKLWLLRQKQTQQWESTPATVNAIAVLLQTGSNWLENKEQAVIYMGNEKVEAEQAEAGTGYIKKTYENADIRPELGKISISQNNDNPAWGAVYWQYFENLEKVTQAKTGLNVEKKLFVEKVTATGKTLEPITSDRPLQVGDKAIVRLTVRNDRDMEYVMLKDMRGACFEPAEQISGTKWKDGTIYYQTSGDASTSFYFDHLPKGTYVFEYPLYITRTGEYSNGNATIQCLYAPEFISHTAGEKTIVK